MLVIAGAVSRPLLAAGGTDGGAGRWPGLALAPAPAPVPSGDAQATERAAAIVAPGHRATSRCTGQGYVRNRTTGAWWTTSQCHVTTRAGGFTVSNDGYVITTGQCVDPGHRRGAAHSSTSSRDRQVDEGRLAAADHGATVADLLDHHDLERRHASGEPVTQRQSYLQRGHGDGGGHRGRGD